MTKKGGTRTPLGRVITAMVTPFDEELEVDLDAAQKLADHLLSSGSDGLVVSGTTGESPTLTDAEKIELFSAVSQVTSGRGKLIAGTGGNSTAASLQLTERAAKAGADAVMLVVPYYNKPPQEGLCRHFATVSESVELPVILYNVPSRTSCNMSADTVVRLATEVPNIVAVKEAAGDLAQASRMISETPDDFYFFSGEDDMNLPYLSVGGNGVISVTAHLIADRLQDMCDAFGSGDVARATRLHEQSLPLTKALFATTNPILVKAAMSILGHRVGGLRLPLIEADAAQLDLLKSAMEAAEVGP